MAPQGGQLLRDRGERRARRDAHQHAFLGRGALRHRLGVGGIDRDDAVQQAACGDSPARTRRRSPGWGAVAGDPPEMTGDKRGFDREHLERGPGLFQTPGRSR